MHRNSIARELAAEARRKPKDKTVRLTPWELRELRSLARDTYRVFEGVHARGEDLLTEDEHRRMRLWKELLDKLSD